MKSFSLPLNYKQATLLPLTYFSLISYLQTSYSSSHEILLSTPIYQQATLLQMRYSLHLLHLQSLTRCALKTNIIFITIQSYVSEYAILKNVFFMAHLNVDTLVMLLIMTGEHAILVVLLQRKLSLRICFRTLWCSQIAACCGQEASKF